MHMNIFNDDAFSAVTMTTALEDVEYQPGLIGSLNLFEDVPTATELISVERRGNTLAIIPTSKRGEDIAEGKRDGRNIRAFPATRIAKGQTIQASEIQGLRAFGEESELETMISYVGRYEKRLVSDVHLTWESHMLGAAQGVVYDADGSVIVDWFDEWGIAVPATINFALNSSDTDVEEICRGVLRKMMRASRGAWTIGSRVVALAGDGFFDKLTKHQKVRETYLNTQQAQNLNRAFGVAAQSALKAGSYAIFDFGGITFINYMGVDDFDENAPKGSKRAVGIKSDEVKFLPINTPGVFQRAFAPGESFEFANTIGRPLYSLMIRDEKRNFWVRPEVYSYPLFMCTRPEMLLTGKAQ